MNSTDVELGADRLKATLRKAFSDYAQSYPGKLTLNLACWVCGCGETGRGADASGVARQFFTHRATCGSYRGGLIDREGLTTVGPDELTIRGFLVWFWGNLPHYVGSPAFKLGSAWIRYRCTIRA